MDSFWNFWNSLTQGFRENLAAQIIGGLIATLLAGGITFFIARIFVKKESPSTQTQQQQIIVNVPPPQIVQSPQVVAPEPPRGEGQPQGLLLQSAPIPRPPQYGFVARYGDQGNNIVECVSELLNQNRAVALIGSGGLGKTTLAAEIVRQAPPSPTLPPSEKPTGEGRNVVWASADGRTDFSLGTLLDEAATQLGNPDIRTLALEQKSNAVRGLLAGVETLHATSLLVIDNFETIAAEQQKAIADFVNTLSCAVLITSRVAVDGAERVNIGAMTPEETQEFLSRWIASSKKMNALTPLIDEIANLAERNPMVMRWIVGQLERAQRMSDVLDELSRGQGDAATRVFGRSFGLLNTDAQATLLSLALFVPSANRTALAFTAGFGDDIQRLNTALKPLADLQLLETDANNDCLSVVGLTRRFTNAQLNKDANVAEYRRRFVDYFVNYAEAHRKTTPEDLDALEDERENLLAAMDVAFVIEDWQNVMRIIDAIAFPGLLDMHGYWDEAIMRGEQAAEAARRMEDAERTALYQSNVATIQMDRGEYERAKVICEQGLDIFKYLKSDMNVAVSLYQLGMIAQNQGDYATAQAYYAESLEINKKLGNQGGIANTWHQLGMIAQDQGDYEAAQAHYAESLEINKKLDNQNEIAITLQQLGNIAYQQGNFETARRHYSESLGIKKRLGSQQGIAITLHWLGNVALSEDHFETAKQLYRETLDIDRRLGYQEGIAWAVNNLGVIAEKEGNNAEAAHLFREALEIFERLKSPDAKIARESLERVSKPSTTNGSRAKDTKKK